MAEFKLERFKYIWRGDWVTGTEYKRDDVVRVGGTSYVCLEGHTADAAFGNDLNATLPNSNPPQPQPRWRIMTDGRSFKGTWTSGEIYNVNDIVVKQGALWVCINGHTAANFVDNEDDWQILAASTKFTGDWETSTDYSKGAVVKYNGIVYKCIENHVSGLFLEDNLVTTPSTLPVTVVDDITGTSAVGVFAINGIPSADLTLGRGKSYILDQSDISNSRFGDTLHPLLLSETEDGTLQGGTIYGVGVTYILDGVEVSQQQYVANFDNELDDNGVPIDKIRQVRITVDPNAPDEIYYYCRYHGNMGGLFTINNTADVAWEVFHNGIEYAGAWTPSTLYRKNDLALYGGSIWKCTETHTSGDEVIDKNNFVIDLPGFQFDGEWSSTTQYQQGDIVRYGGYLYFANQDNIDDQPAQEKDSTNVWVELAYSYNFRGEWSKTGVYNPGDIVDRGGELYMALISIGGVEQDGSTLDYIDTGAWELLVPSKVWGGAWIEEREYHVGEIVYHFGTSYVCNEYHVSTNNNFPGDNGSGYYYWDELIQAGEASGLTAAGDLLTFNLSRQNVGDGSTIGSTNVRIGAKDQLLKVDNDDNVFWENWLSSPNVVFVAKEGVDLPGHGSELRPFRTVKYACQYVEDNFNPYSPVKVKINAGRFEEICPISIPAGTVVMGDELRSTTIVANAPIPEYQDEWEYLNDLHDYIVGILFDLFQNRDVDASPGNTATQPKGNPVLGLEEVNIVNNFKDLYVNEIDFLTRSGDINVDVVGTNTLTADAQRRQTANRLERLVDFIVAEAQAWTAFNYPTKTFTNERISDMLRELYRAICYDLRYEGNYKTLQAAEHYSNAVNGSRLSDMFRVRDVTGVRNTTLEGLVGVLNPPGVYDIYQRPTAGAFVALDPGWGPDDERVWIKERSPYLQGDTCIGTACVGKRVDGRLHNGGNKSMTSNDFTQVLSDGIGAWVSHNARAELVSVFTYYNTVGYFAEAGGVIRAANGNNSYGRFGSIAAGIDPNEVPIEAKVFNRDNDPIIKGVFAGQFADEISLLEWEHCGEEFTEATANVVGAGVDAEVIFEEFRNGALYKSRLVNPEDSGATGGVGYYVAQNQARDGNTTTIQLASGETATEAEILNARIYIVSGTGTGQFGYVQAYNESSKTVTVYKDSDNTPGWDHIIPGTPVEAALATNTQYRIEPRIAVSHPGFTDAAYNLPNSREIIDIAFSDTTFSFTDIEGTLGTGDVETQDGLEPAVATFDIVKNGLTYDVTIVDGGLGYAVGDTITILGSTLGGQDVVNDCIIKVNKTSEDSSNSITEVVVSGNGRSGKWVAVASPNFVLNSDDATSWNEGTLPNSLFRDWVKVRGGNNRFVAIAKGTDEAAYSLDGITWTATTMPSVENWTDMVFAQGKFVAIAESSSAVAWTMDGENWTTESIPDDATGDSTASEWQAITYGAGKFVVVSGNDGVVAQSTDAQTWTTAVVPVLDNINITWAGLAHGNNRYVLVSEDGQVFYSFDADTWTQGDDMPSADGSTVMRWSDMKYSQGVFFAICDSGLQPIGGDLDGYNTNFCATSEDGISWTGRSLGVSRQWHGLGFGVVDGVGYWTLGSVDEPIGGITRVQTGCRAKVRADITGVGTFDSIKIHDCGSGYSTENPPIFTVYDNTHTAAVGWENRVGNGVIAPPTWIDRGNGYRTNSTRVTVTGDGYADIIPESTIVKIYGLPKVPDLGSQLLFANIDEPATEDPDDLKSYRTAKVTDLGDDGTGNGTRLVEFQISPRIRTEDDLVHDTVVTINENFSQCRISGHDFLDIGTGNFEETNYPELYAGGAFFTAAPENEVYETEGGRVFYVSTDQDGNFRAGELFSVQQATGIVTISAQFFDLDGLSELALGGVRLGGSGAVVNEFSTDPTFAADSNNVIPTQRAIATFLADRLSVGGSDLEINAIIAGQIFLGSDDNLIASNTGVTLNFGNHVDMQGQDALGNDVGIQGSWVQQMMYYRNFDESMK